MPDAGRSSTPVATPTVQTPVRTTLADLATALPPLETHALSMDAYDAFSADQRLYALAVVDGEHRPVGILNRFKFLERLSRPFGRDLLTRQPVERSMDPAPLVVDEHVSPDELSTMLLDDAAQYIFDGFIVTREGRYLGIGTGFSLVRHLTDRRQATLFHMAHHDSLTGAPNRQLFGDRLAQALTRARRDGSEVGLLFLDVDRLKVVNDTLGHAVGDLVLKGVVSRITRELREVDTVARLSGDEFAVILPDLQASADAERVAEKVLNALRAPYVAHDADFNVSCSIGVAVYPADAANEAGLQRAADLAVYEAKQFRNTVQRFTSDIQHTHPTTLLAYTSVRRALDDRRITVHYQPQVDVRSRRIIGVEALVRWHDPARGDVPAMDLIRLAEDSGLITGVTERVLAAALPQLLEWKRLAGHRELALAVNVSGVQLRDGSLVSLLERHLQVTGFPASDLELEITETTLMLGNASTASTLKALRALGVRLSIDDFGTGYSSLSRLQRLPVTGVKIDRTFVQGIDGDDSGALAQAILLMGHSLGLTVTGEGVETPHQLAFLESHGCDVLQGYLLARPMAADACGDLLRRSSGVPGFRFEFDGSGPA